MNIGRVYRDSYVNKLTKEVVKTLVLDIRTFSAKHTFSISVNKLKYPDGVINTNIVAGKEEHPDYHIWASLAKRGESGWSEIVGNICNAKNDDGLVYKRAVLFDPFLSKENIYFALFSVDADKKVDENHLYNAVARPYRNMGNSNDTHSSHSAQPNYGEPQQTYTKQDGSQIPMESEAIDYDPDEIPF